MRRRVMLLALTVLVVLSMVAISPALAHDRDRDCWDEDEHHWVCERDRDHDKVRYYEDDEVEVCFVPVLVPWGFWNFDWFWGWFWVDWGSYWDCLD
jgi:hypothetical protein